MDKNHCRRIEEHELGMLRDGMKKENRLAVAECLAEIGAVVGIAKKPMTRRSWLMARRWHRFQKEKLTVMGYRGKIVRLPKHVLKAE